MCACCGRELDYQRRGKCASPASPSLDRVNVAMGYVSGNVAVVCHRCNVLKGDASAEEHEMIAAYIRRAWPKAVPL